MLPILSTHRPLWQGLINGLTQMPPEALSADQSHALLRSLQECGGALHNLAEGDRQSLQKLFQGGHIQPRHWGNDAVATARFSSIRDICDRTASLTARVATFTERSSESSGPQKNSLDEAIAEALVRSEERGILHRKATRFFFNLLQSYLEKYFDGDLIKMACALRPKSKDIKSDITERKTLLYGDIPISYKELIEKWVDPLERHGIHCLRPLTRAWLKDQIRRLDACKPIQAASPTHKKLVHLFRQAALLRSTVIILSDSSKRCKYDLSNWNLHETLLPHWLIGTRWPTTDNLLETIHRFIFEAGLAGDEEIRSLISIYLEEIKSRMTDSTRETYNYEDAALAASRKNRLIWPTPTNPFPIQDLREIIARSGVKPYFLDYVEILLETGEFPLGRDLALRHKLSPNGIYVLIERNLEKVRRQLAIEE